MQIIQGTLKLDLKEIVARDTLKLRFGISALKTLTGASYDDSFSFAPGQFVSIKFGEKSWRAYSIASLPQDDQLELVVRLVEGGVASEAFRTAQLKDTFDFKGPFGHFVLSDNDAAHLVFCATGTGIAPFRSMILHESQKELPRNMTLLYGGRDDKDIAYLDEIQDWSPSLNIKLGLSRQDSDPELGIFWQKERITHFLNTTDFDDRTEFYICGNGSMVVDTQNLILEKGFEKSQIFMERFN